MRRWRLVVALLLLVLAGDSQPCAAARRVEIRKAERRLLVLDGDVVHASLRIALGLAPVGAKEHQGDRRTPEGDYFVTHRNPRSRYFLSLGLSYPNAADAQRGLEAGIISRAQQAAIVRANADRLLPPQDTPLGGEIFIHGNGSATDWTWGCIALDDADMRTLYAMLPPGTPVRIVP